MSEKRERRSMNGKGESPLISWLEEALKEKGFSFGKNDLENIALVQKIFANSFPFENLDVLLNREDAITPDFLHDKMISQKRGGLCYEINPLLFLVLKELGMNVYLSAATDEPPPLSRLKNESA